MEKMTLVAATDFSEAGRAAAARAATIARDHEARLHLVYGFDETSWENLRSLATPKKNLFADQPLHQAWERIRAAADHLSRNYGIAASGVVAMGRASEAIAATADALKASLIALGPHGRRLADRLYLGSTALKTARIAACPVLVVRNRPGPAYVRCLVGIDFSPPSERAAAAAARLFPAAEITLLHAVRSVEGPMLYTGALRAAVDAAKEKLRREALQRLARAFPDGQPGRLDGARRRAVIGPAHLALRRMLDRRRYGLVALGRDSKAELAERVLGSTPANVMLNAPADVLIVP
jgi:nucleotide-binding universal stress UspA family protein